MPARPQTSKQGEQPKTLAQAKEMLLTEKMLLAQTLETLAELKRKIPGTSGALGVSTPPVQAPVPKVYPTGPPRPNPDPSRPGSPGTNRGPVPKVFPPETPGNPAQGLSGMAPNRLKMFLAERTDKELHVLLAAENSKPWKQRDPKAVAILYREIQKRRK
jgi:hypothetical protein